MTPEDIRALDILASTPDGATAKSLITRGIGRDVLERLVFAGYLRRDVDLFTRSREETSSRFYLTSAGRKARGASR